MVKCFHLSFQTYQTSQKISRMGLDPIPVIFAWPKQNKTKQQVWTQIHEELFLNDKKIKTT